MAQKVGYNRETLLEMLHNREVTIKFEKQDGTVRTLRGTLADQLIPQQPVKTGSKESRKRPSDVVTVWDLDAAGWRSFHPDSVIEIE